MAPVPSIMISNVDFECDDAETKHSRDYDNTSHHHSSETNNLRRDYRKAVDCLVQCETIIQTLQDKLASKDEHIATLEAKIVQMSLELASSKAFEDEHRSTRRDFNMSSSLGDIFDRDDEDDGEDSRSRNEGSRSASPKPNKDGKGKKPLFRAATAGVTRSSRRRVSAPDSDVSSASQTKQSRMGRRASCTDTITPSRSHQQQQQHNHNQRQKKQTKHWSRSIGQWGQSSTEDLDVSFNEDALDESASSGRQLFGNSCFNNSYNNSCQTLDESSSSRLELLGSFFQRKNRVNEEKKDDEIDGSDRAQEGQVEVTTKSSDPPGRQERRPASKRRQQRQYQASSRSFLDGVVFPRDFDDVVEKGGIE